MTFKEHNNRKKADKYAEYITGDGLRRYVAQKVKQYAGDNVSVFDGAAGSGQLEQYIQPTAFTTVEIQAEACEVLKQNYPQADVYNQSFFTYVSEDQADVAIMNPPFSIKFKDLPDEDKEQIQRQYPWKKSGVVDDIFLLKSLECCKRYGFYIMFPGISYRKTEQKMRQLIGARLQELNVVRNAFDDTSIDVLFLVIDKDKTDVSISKEIYDAKNGQVILTQKDVLNPDFDWEMPREEIKKEEIDIDEVNNDLDELTLQQLEKHLQISLMIETVFKQNMSYLEFIARARQILDKYERMYKGEGRA